MLKITQLFIYPIKSLGGISLKESEVTLCGLNYDRRWMLVDADGKFLTQRTDAGMALFTTAFTNKGISVTFEQDTIVIPFNVETQNVLQVQIWDNQTTAIEVSETMSSWFSKNLNLHCKLVYLPDNALVQVDMRYAENGDVTSLSDGYPSLFVSEQSLTNLNEKLETPIGFDRFRPNVVFEGNYPHHEDDLTDFKINGIPFKGAKKCARCVVTTINQTNGTAGKEPLKTLSTYRTQNNKIYFGMNVLHKGTGKIQVGDFINIAQ
jgi:uncharacterized protein